MVTLLGIIYFCTPTTVTNETRYAWNDFDKTTLERAKVRCGEIWPDTPCLSKFIKRDKIDYHAVCSAKKKGKR